MTGINVVKNLLTFKSYKYEIVEENSDFFLEPYRIEFEKWIKYYKYSDFVGKTFEIDKITYESYNITAKSTNKYDFWLDNTYIAFESDEKKGNYCGNILKMENGVMVSLDNIFPVDIEITVKFQVIHYGHQLHLKKMDYF